jgi:hypothetical protein
MTSRRITKIEHPALVGIDYTNSFAISYDEPVCGVCKSKMIVHKIERHNWDFFCAMCRAEIDREVINLVEWWEKVYLVVAEEVAKPLPEIDESDIV